ncbi:TetR/AcrR family transcriptional regulator [Actinomadura decatromicini]|uniref:TetR/AcrR family transcriptional regulator n=1 Tax=Actinomadura decatromicini TaxID=2604572 RepID=A0A5D3FA50_9ACTN|nr:TetR/AcrR family transcriptional regulator [Actinomadura decatromicini]TYK45837.1 TetR/AcrR family transcriptional regulator [Actinomadura decatromicini]
MSERAVAESVAPVRRSAVERRILAAALRLFAERGFDGTSVQGIVDAAEVTKGALYHYFDSKHDLLYEIHHSLIARQLADLGAVLDRGLPPREALRAALTGLIVSTAEHIDEAKVFTREMHRLDDARMRSVREDRRRYHLTFRTLVERGQRDGAFGRATPADTVTIVALGMVNQMPAWYRADGPKSAERLADEVADFVLAGLG